MNNPTRAAILMLLVFAFAFAACGGKGETDALYHCPMHPDYVSDKPGDCPICGMRLVPIEKAGAPSKGAGANERKKVEGVTEAVVYTCPMHPEVRSNEPGKCPICGMDLEPVKRPASGAPSTSAPGQPAGAGREGHEHGAEPGSVAATTPGTTLTLTPDQARLAGVRTVAATRGRIEDEIRAVGTVEADESRVRQVTTKVAGFVEKLHVSAVGQLVRAGEPMLELYSPELLASQEEYLRAAKTSERFSQSALPEVRQGGLDLAAAAKRRLVLFDVPPEFIERLERTGVVERLVTFRAPFGGYVTEKSVLEGQRIEPGMPLLTLSDLSRVWVTAQVYEAEAAVAKVGRSATVMLPHDPAVNIKGRVSFVYPTLDVESRTLKVRLELANPKLTLKPGMFVNVDLGDAGDAGVLIPDSAILDSGTRSIVFVERSPGEFEAREVSTGARADGQAIVRSGLAEGERVAIAANFLLDSESRLRNAISAATSGKRQDKQD